MIQNFFRIAIRNISRHKGFTFINVTGLAVGLAASLLILLWVQDEFSFEKFNLNAGNIYRVEEDQAIEPMAFALAPVSYLRVILIRLTPGNIPESLKAVEKSWKAIVPEYPLDYTFIDQDYEKLFKSQIRLSGLLKYFTILAVIIACLGLYGLSSYSAERRTNEVGIRKVMGAGSFTVMYTLAKEFLLPVKFSPLTF